MMFQITGYDHVGIRVSERDPAVKFYEALGFRIDPAENSPSHEAVGMINDAGIRINLIYNAIKRPGNKNILMDEPVKYPGLTHPAFIVDDLNGVMKEMERRGIKITEGPIEFGSRRSVCFVRDPDGNVLEFDELFA